jgi:hypothetical protein
VFVIQSSILDQDDGGGYRKDAFYRSIDADPSMKISTAKKIWREDQPKNDIAELVCFEFVDNLLEIITKKIYFSLYY